MLILIYQTIQRHIADDGNLYSHRHENLKSDTIIVGVDMA
jgi:hypothetical protein